MKERAFGSVVASAVAGLFVMSAAHAQDAAAPAAGDKPAAYCQNNSCKGKSACGAHGSSDKGKNSCKGHGFLEAKDAAECKKAGGVWKTK
ncbi:MAG: hypothetical protein EOP10_02240 [Proteobacteria bacterium]|nr:MAG: hypothetical protein EOP10_02240 [Pseudomonadota bacterium]